MGEIFLLNKMSIAMKWAKAGQYREAEKLVSDIDADLSLKHALSLKLPTMQPASAVPAKIGNKFKSNKL